MITDGEYPLSILVPFYPESKLSGIGFEDFMKAVWYRRTLYWADSWDTLYGENMQPILICQAELA